MKVNPLNFRVGSFLADQPLQKERPVLSGNLP
jgi:hypothetical protein